MTVDELLSRIVELESENTELRRKLAEAKREQEILARHLQKATGAS